jgi:superfamily I DNA/RNA helicase
VGWIGWEAVIVASLGISREFLAAYAGLQRPVRRAIDAAIGKFAEHTHAGLHLEKLEHARDPHVRTIRISQFYRGVVLAAGNQDYVLLTVMPHDDAIAYAMSRRFTVNQALGVLEVRDQERLDVLERSIVPPPVAALFDGIADADLRRLGIEPKLFPLIRAVTTETQLDAFAAVLPDTQHSVLTGLASGMSVEEVWAELAERIVSNVDTEDLVGAARRTSDRIAFVSGPHELASILAHPFDAWRTFLHPLQRDIAYRETYAGPVLITGSAGTGKTVTALHRAVFLAERLPADASKVLITTFTRTLAETLQKQLGLLTDDKTVRDRIDVISVDRLAYGIVSAKRSGQIKIAEPATTRALWEAAAQSGPTYWSRTGIATRYSGTFLEREWEQVILAQRLTTLEAYRGAPRRGRGDAMRADQRERVWAAVTEAVSRLAGMRRHTHLQLADEAAAITQRSGPGAYRHVIVDEGQDLHPAQWRLLRAIVPAGPNDMFLVADPHQRIYDHHVSLASLGIEIRGRSRRLTLNYRTTHEILAWSVGVLTGEAPVGLDDDVDTLAGYRSVTRGRPPLVTAHPDRTAELGGLVERVGTWLEQGVEPHAIGIAARNTHLVGVVATTLADAHIPVAGHNGEDVGVRVATMHQLKGLEFQCLAVVGLDAGVLPAANAITDATEDPVSHRQDLQRERCLLFVAATRARDMLYLSHAGRPSSLLPS